MKNQVCRTTYAHLRVILDHAPPILFILKKFPWSPKSAGLLFIKGDKHPQEWSKVFWTLRWSSKFFYCVFTRLGLHMCLSIHWLGTHKIRLRTLDIHEWSLWGSLGFWPNICRSYVTWDPWRHHVSIVILVKLFKLSSWKLNHKVDPSEWAWLRGCLSMTRLLFLSPQIFSYKSTWVRIKTRIQPMVSSNL